MATKNPFPAKEKNPFPAKEDKPDEAREEAPETDAKADENPAKPGAPEDDHEKPEGDEDSEQEPAEDDQAEDDEPETDVAALQAEVEKWKALSRKNEAAAKKNEAAAKAYAELKDSQKPDEQKSQEQESELASQLEEAQHQIATLQAIVTHGLDKEDVDLLKGLPADAIDGHAQKLAARLKPPQKPSPSTGIGNETPPGATTSGDWLRDRITQNR